jgi:hypothetical protein
VAHRVALHGITCILGEHVCAKMHAVADMCCCLPVLLPTHAIVRMPGSNSAKNSKLWIIPIFWHHASAARFPPAIRGGQGPPQTPTGRPPQPPDASPDTYIPHPVVQGWRAPFFLRTEGVQEAAQHAEAVKLTAMHPRRVSSHSAAQQEPPRLCV